ncbi:MAG: MCE family protein [Acidimicrobiales bacterium]
MKARMITNIVAFVVIAVGLIGYGIFDLLGNPFQHATVVSATFPNASGIEPNFGVVLQGVVVGSVDGVQLTARGARVLISLRPGEKVPSNVVASIGLANDLGEQQVQFTPVRHPSANYLRNGSVVRVAKGGVPVQVGKVIGTASRLLSSIGATHLNSLLASLSEGLAGQSQNLQTIMTASETFSQEFLAYEHQFEALLANSAPVLDGLSNDGAQLRQDLASTEVLANVLDQHRYNLVRLLANGARASTVATQLLDATRPNLACILHDFADLSANGASPANLSNLSVGLATNQWFFGAVEQISPSGPAVSLFPGDPYNAHQVWLRTRLFIPPGSPPAAEYPKATQLGPVLPGAGCNTEFGKGVGPATQRAAQFPVAGTHVDPATPSAAFVRGGADSSPARTAAARSGVSSPRYSLTADQVPLSRPNGPYGWLALGVASLFGLFLLVPRRRRYARIAAEASSMARPRRKERS